MLGLASFVDKSADFVFILFVVVCVFLLIAMIEAKTRNQKRLLVKSLVIDVDLIYVNDNNNNNTICIKEKSADCVHLLLGLAFLLLLPQLFISACFIFCLFPFSFLL